jgi:WD40-like Beta Propeller Repeat
MAKSNHSGALAAAAGVLVAMGLLLLMVAVQAQPAEATFPGLLGNIAYMGSDGIDTEIFTINPNGGGRVQGTNNDTLDSEPSYSPDGKKIAYVGFDGTDEEIYTIYVGGGTAFQVTNNDTDDGVPSWGILP